MMEPKFTRGDWTAKFHEMGGYDSMYDAWCIESGDDVIAVLDLGDYGAKPCEQFESEEAEANAHLLKAAPVLYEALCDMVSDKDNLSEATIDFAKRALAKARGEA